MSEFEKWLKRYRPIITVASITVIVTLCILFARGCVSRSYNSMEVLSKEEIVTVKANVYEGREVTAEKLENDYYNSRIKELNEINGEDVSNRFVLLKSYYYGVYSKDYEEDLENYKELIGSKIYQYVTSTGSEELAGLLPNARGNHTYEEDSELPFSVIVRNESDLDDASKDALNQSLYLLDMTLVGVIDDRFYVYSYGINSDKLVVVDMSTYIQFVEEDTNLSDYCRKLGETYNIQADAGFYNWVEINEIETLLVRGF